MKKKEATTPNVHPVAQEVFRGSNPVGKQLKVFLSDWSIKLSKKHQKIQRLSKLERGHTSTAAYKIF